jgi:hypothetical protein
LEPHYVRLFRLIKVFSLPFTSGGWPGNDLDVIMQGCGSSSLPALHPIDFFTSLHRRSARNAGQRMKEKKAGHDHAPAVCVLFIQWMWDRLQALQFLFNFLLLLAVNAQGSDRSGFQTFLGNVFSALVTNPKSTVVDSLDGILDFLDEFSFPVSDSKSEIPV